MATSMFPSFRKTRIALLLAALPILAQPVMAEFTGPEFQLNTHTASSQRVAKVAMDADGNFVAVWTSAYQDGDGEGIYGQRYDAAGVPLGDEFQVNTYAKGNQYAASVTMDADGDFLVVWAGAKKIGPGYNVYGQRYSAAGAPRGREFRVNTAAPSPSAYDQPMPVAAMDAEGDFVVVWQSEGQDGDGKGVYAQRYNAAGMARGGEFQVNTYTVDDQQHPAVAMDANGNFVVAWSSKGQDGSSRGVYAQRYNAAGVAQGSEIRVNGTTGGSQSNPAVAMDSSGNFVVAWDDGDTHTSGVNGQRYDASGVAQGSEFAVDSSRIASAPAVAMNATGDFVVVWYADTGPGGAIYDVYGQKFSASGTKQGSEFMVNIPAHDVQMAPAVAMDAAGNFVIAWEAIDYLGSGVTSTEVFARLDRPADTTPNAYDFADQTGIPQNTVVFSDIVTLTGFRAQGIDIDIADANVYAIYRVYSSATSTWGSWNIYPSTVYPGDKVQLRMSSGGAPAASRTTTLTTGDLAVDWTVTTEPADTIPDAFAFADKSGQATNQRVTSNTISPTGINKSAAISISSGAYRVYTRGVWGGWTTKPGNFPVGSKVQVRAWSAATANTTTHATLTIGGVSDTFDVTTAP